MLPVLPPPIEYAVPSAEVKVPAAQATVSASVTEKTDVCVQPLAAMLSAPIATTTEEPTVPPVMVMLEAVTAPDSSTKKYAVARLAYVSPAQKRTSSPPVTVEASPILLAKSRI